MKCVYCLLPLLALGLPLMVEAKSYVAEVYFVVGRDVVTNYQKVGAYTKAKAIQTIKEDMNFMIYQVNLYFATMKSKGLDIQIRMTKLHFEKRTIFNTRKDIKTLASLKQFKTYLKKKSLTANPPFDMSVLLTGHNLVGDKGATTKGYATEEAACTSGKPGPGMAVVEFSGIQADAISIAHELGHILGASHDKLCSPKAGYILAPTSMASNKHRWEFSACTATKIKTYIKKLDKSNSNCLTTQTTAKRPHKFSMSSMNGKDIMDPHKICQRSLMSSKSFMCLNSQYYRTLGVCRQLFCAKEGSKRCTDAMPTEGMVCDVGKRCNKGSCVKDPKFRVSKRVKAGCVHGEKNILFTKPNPYNGKCADYLKRHDDAQCYFERVSSQCCETCEKRKKTHLGNNCKWGDKRSFCAKYTIQQVCPIASNKDFCCDKCRNFKG